MGRTSCLVNVAVQLAERGLRVLVVDGDVEAPGLSAYHPFREALRSRSGDAAVAGGVHDLVGLLGELAALVQSRLQPERE